MSKVLVAGGGAAGMFAAICASGSGNEVHLFEKNDKLGKKLFITGKGRCNITNVCDIEELLRSVMTNPKFMYSSFFGFTNQDAIDFFESLGVKTKTERGNRVFPVSDHSSDVIRALRKEMERLNVKIHLNAEIQDVEVEREAFSHLILRDGTKISGDSLIIATGGFSYQATGSTGDGYRFAEKMGHHITELYPSLVPMEIGEAFAGELQGLSLRNVEAAVWIGKKEVYRDFGEMLFTHYGVSGPLILSAASMLGTRLRGEECKLIIDLKPALSYEQLDQRILREFGNNQNKQFRNAIKSLFPAKLIPIMVRLSKIGPDKPVNLITKEERLGFVQLIKKFTMTIIGLRGFNEAIITKGGVDIKEINPKTMESKLVSGVYFAGEVMDVDALTGGFNLQIAWSTAYAAGKSVGMGNTESPI